MADLKKLTCLNGNRMKKTTSEKGREHLPLCCALRKNKNISQADIDAVVFCAKFRLSNTGDRDVPNFLKKSIMDCTKR